MWGKQKQGAAEERGGEGTGESQTPKEDPSAAPMPLAPGIEFFSGWFNTPELRFAQADEQRKSGFHGHT